MRRRAIFAEARRISHRDRPIVRDTIGASCPAHLRSGVHAVRGLGGRYTLLHLQHPAIVQGRVYRI